MKETFTLVATAAAGLEAVVGRELRELGYDTQVENVEDAEVVEEDTKEE